MEELAILLGKTRESLVGKFIVQEPGGWVFKFQDLVVNENNDIEVLFIIIDSDEEQERMTSGLSGQFYSMPIEKWNILTPVTKREIWEKTSPL